MSPSRRPEGEAGPERTPPGDPLAGRRVLLGVCGGIAAYKAAYLARALVRAGARVHVVMTANATRFVAPLTFETLSGNPVVTSSFDRVHALGAVEHVDLAGWADLVLVAPATYNLLGKLRAGIADDALTTLLSAVTVPVFLVPAMNEHMWRNPINQRNVSDLRALGYRFVDPERGGLACSWEGEGRMREPEAIVDEVLRALGAGIPVREPATTPGSLAGRTVLVSAAGTREAIDPVRFVGNRSSGRMGYALAAAAARRGARVALVSGPSHLPVPPQVEDFQRVESAQEMLEALRARLARADVLFMAAAVADYRPQQPAPAKMKRAAAGLDLHLVPTPDLLQELGRDKGERLFVGFALETDDPEVEARAKLVRKRLDLVVANRVGPGTGPDAETNQVWVYDANGLVLETPVADKNAIAEAILGLVEARLATATRKENVRA